MTSADELTQRRLRMLVFKEERAVRERINVEEHTSPADRRRFVTEFWARIKARQQHGLS